MIIGLQSHLRKKLNEAQLKELQKKRAWFKNVKNKSVEEIPARSNFNKTKMESMSMKNSLTVKSVLIAVVVFLVRYIGTQFLPDEMVQGFIDFIMKVLDVVGITATGTALYGMRRAVQKSIDKV